MTNQYAIYLGLDTHRLHLCAIDSAGETLCDEPIPVCEVELTSLIARLSSHGEMLALVHIPQCVASLAPQIVLSLGIDLAFQPALSRTLPAPSLDWTPATVNAHTMAQSAWKSPEGVRGVTIKSAPLAEDHYFSSYAEDLSREILAISRRITRLLTTIHPPLAQTLSIHLQNLGVLDLLIQFGGPTTMRECSDSISQCLHRGPKENVDSLTQDIIHALNKQKTPVEGTQGIELVITQLARQIVHTITLRADLETLKLAYRQAQQRNISHDVDASQITRRVSQYRQDN